MTGLTCLALTYLMSRVAPGDKVTAPVDCRGQRLRDAIVAGKISYNGRSAAVPIGCFLCDIFLPKFPLTTTSSPLKLKKTCNDVTLGLGLEIGLVSFLTLN